MHYPKNRLTDLTIELRNTHYEYDDVGNLIKDGNASYEYNAFNQTTKIETFDGNVQINKYDAEGLRYEVEENDKLVQFIFNHDREVVAEKQDDSWRSYIRKSELLFSSAEHARTYYHYASDEMGSITHITDGDRVLNSYSYDVWGEVVSEREEVGNRFKFNGQQLDPITGQYYLRARYYNPVIGRFTQEDTYRGDGLNLYSYCRNNPVYYVDPTGHDSSKANSYKVARDSGEYSSFRELMSEEEVVRYNEQWYQVAKTISDEALDSHIDFIKKGGIKKSGGGAFKPAKVSAGVNMETGDIAFGYNGVNKFNPSKNTMHPDLQNLIDSTKKAAKNDINNEYAVRESYELWSVDNCAEIYAANNSLINGANIDEIFLNTKKFENKVYAPPCENCKVTFKDFRMPNK